MIILLSPAKTLDLSPVERHLPATKPEFLADAKELAAVAKKLSPKQVGQLMELSDTLAETAHGYFRDWKQKWDAKLAKQAVLMFQGDVYQGLDAETLSREDLEHAQDNLRLLSGMYGLLRPLDLIQPYRLEMGRPLANPRGKDLYAFWGDRVREALEGSHEADRSGLSITVNLASNEYAKAARLKKSSSPVVTPAFKDRKNGKLRVVSFFAKRARGTMARYLIQQRVADAAGLRRFRGMGYRLDRELSTDEAPVFTRDQPDGPAS